jgi:hypothetical protein
MTPSDESNDPLSPVFTEAILESISDGVFTVDSRLADHLFQPCGRGDHRRAAGGGYRPACVRKCSGPVCAKRNAPFTRRAGPASPSSANQATLLAPMVPGCPSVSPPQFSKTIAANVVGGAETFRDMSEVDALRRELDGRFQVGDFVSRSILMQKVFEVLPAISASPSTVLIYGETGTGKELMARTIHDLEPKR